MTYTRVGTSTATGVTTGQTSVTIVKSAVGNLFVLWIEVSSLTIVPTAITGGGVTGWNISTYAPGSFGTATLLWGTVSATGSAAATITYSAAIGSTGINTSYTEYHSSTGSTWLMDVFGGAVNITSVTTAQYPSLTPSVSGELYVGKEFDAASASTAGSTPGCTYAADSSSYYWVFNPNTTAVLAPTCGLTGSGPYITTAAIFTTGTLTTANSDFFMIF